MAGNFTPAEIEDARNNPRAGDVWFHGYPRFEYTVTVERGAFREFDGHESMVVKSEDNPLAGGMVSVDVFRQWSLHATLVRRGDA